MHYVLNATFNMVWAGWVSYLCESSPCLKWALASASTAAAPKKPAWHPDETEAAAELGLSRSQAVVRSGSWRRSAFVFGIKRKSSSSSSRVFGALARHLPAQWCHTMSRADLTAAPEVDLDVGGWRRTGGSWCRCRCVLWRTHSRWGMCLLLLQLLCTQHLRTSARFVHKELELRHGKGSRGLQRCWRGRCKENILKCQRGWQL